MSQLLQREQELAAEVEALKAAREDAEQRATAATEEVPFEPLQALRLLLSLYWARWQSFTSNKGVFELRYVLICR